MGGNPEFPKPIDSRVYLYRDRIELRFWNGDYYNNESDLSVLFGSIVNIENMDEKKISALRVIGLGMVFIPLAIVGAMWKKNHIYTVIKYKEDSAEKAIILDFRDNVEIVQGWIFRRLLNSRTSSKVTTGQEFMIYENYQHGFTISYPRTWVDDELQQKRENYTEIVKIRKFVENKSPFVTVYVTDIQSSNLDSQALVNREMETVRNDANMSVVESSNLVIDNKPAATLVYVDYNGYKRKVIWIQSNDIVYKISYYVEKGQYLEFLPAVDEMVKSFKVGNPSPNVSTETLENQKRIDLEHPLKILMTRFAKGEITEEQYKRMRSILNETDEHSL
jgi:hypothetical protein